jgi:serine/threonine-protein kinase PknK
MTPEIPGYSRFELIGRGGHAQVYRCWDETLQRTVAVKVGAANDELLHREARRLAAFDPGLPFAIVHAGGTTRDRRPYFVMEYLGGGSLAERVASRGGLSEDEVLDIAVALTTALVTAHHHGLLHCDIKPENVLFTTGGEARLADLGIAALVRGGADDTWQGSLSLGHAAPEQLDDGTVSPQSDLYALGSTLRAALRGLPSDGFTTLLAELTAAEPKDRPTSAALVLDRMTDLQQTRRSSRTLATTPPRRAADPIRGYRLPVPGDDPLVDDLDAVRSTQHWLIAIVGVLSVLSGVLAALLVLR